MRKAVLMILAAAMMAQSVQAHSGPSSGQRTVASAEQMSVEAKAAVVAIRNRAKAILESGQSEVSAQELQELSSAAAGLTAAQRLEVLDSVIMQLQQMRHYMEIQSGAGSETAAGGALVVYSVLAGCLTAIMFVNDDAAKPSLAKWIGVVVTAASIGGVVAMSVGSSEADRLRDVTNKLTKALQQAQQATLYQIEADTLQ